MFFWNGFILSIIFSLWIGNTSMLNVDARNRKRMEVAEMCTFMVLQLVLWKLLFLRCHKLILQLSCPVFSNCCFLHSIKEAIYGISQEVFLQEEEENDIETNVSLFWQWYIYTTLNDHYLKDNHEYACLFNILPTVR